MGRGTEDDEAMNRFFCDVARDQTDYRCVKCPESSR